MSDNLGIDTEVAKRNGNVTDKLIAESALLSDCEVKGCVQGHQRTGGREGERERERERERETERDRERRNKLNLALYYTNHVNC